MDESARVVIGRGVVDLSADRTLLDAFRAGDAAVLERIYYAYVDDVFRLAALGFATASGAIRPELDPDEQRAVVQEVFARAFAERARTAYDGLRPYRPYLLTIARNLMVDRARARASERARSAEVDVDAIIAADAPLPGEVAEAVDLVRRRERARAYVATLDAEARTFVELRFDHDLSQAEIASRMRVTRRRVRTLEARVLDGLRDFLADQRPE